MYVMPKKTDRAVRDRAVRLIYSAAPVGVSVVHGRVGVGHEFVRRRVLQADVHDCR